MFSCHVCACIGFCVGVREPSISSLQAASRVSINCALCVCRGLRSVSVCVCACYDQVTRILFPWRSPTAQQCRSNQSKRFSAYRRWPTVKKLQSHLVLRHSALLLQFAAAIVKNNNWLLGFYRSLTSLMHPHPSPHLPSGITSRDDLCKATVEKSTKSCDW